MTGNHTTAVVKGREEYDTLKESLGNVICDVNALIQEGSMMVDGQNDFYLGGHYKVNMTFKAVK